MVTLLLTVLRIRLGTNTSINCSEKRILFIGEIEALSFVHHTQRRVFSEVFHLFPKLSKMIACVNFCWDIHCLAWLFQGLLIHWKMLLKAFQTKVIIASLHDLKSFNTFGWQLKLIVTSVLQLHIFLRFSLPLRCTQNVKHTILSLIDPGKKARSSNESSGKE